MGYGRNNYRRPAQRQSAGRIERANSRPGPCRYCGLEIPANRGQLWREEDGSWSVVHVPQRWHGSPVSGQYVGGCPEDTAKLNREGGWGKYVPSPDAATRARHCEQAQAGYFYCEATPDDPCGPGPNPHAGHVPGQCAAH